MNYKIIISVGSYFMVRYIKKILQYALNIKFYWFQQNIRFMSVIARQKANSITTGYFSRYSF